MVHGVGTQVSALARHDAPEAVTVLALAGREAVTGHLGERGVEIREGDQSPLDAPAVLPAPRNHERHTVAAVEEIGFVTPVNVAGEVPPASISFTPAPWKQPLSAAKTTTVFS